MNMGGLYRDSYHGLRVSQHSGSLFGVLTIKIVVVWGLLAPALGNYQMEDRV